MYTESYLTAVTCAGCLGQRRHSDYPDDPQQRHHQEPAHLPVKAVVKAVAPARATCAGVGPRLVYVPNQHRPHDPQAGVPRSCR